MNSRSDQRKSTLPSLYVFPVVFTLGALIVVVAANLSDQSDEKLVQLDTQLRADLMIMAEPIEVSLQGASPSMSIEAADDIFLKDQNNMSSHEGTGDWYRLGAAQVFGAKTTSQFKEGQRYLYLALNQGSGDAAYLLGVTYLSGLGKGTNEKHAYQLFQTAIEKGNSNAFGEAGRMRELGWGIDANESRAISLYEQGAALGDTYCMRRLSRVGDAVSGTWQSPAVKDDAFETRKKARELLPDGFLY